MFWTIHARIASARLLPPLRTTAARTLALSTGAMVAGTAFAVTQQPMHLESVEPKKYDYIERSKPRPAPVLKRRVIVEEILEEAEDSGATEKPETAAERALAEDPEGEQSAFDERTGEINWDCPCLGGMADGPCGEEFKRAFSCFIFSEQEPKGIDCVDKFKDMQDCFRRHPEVYAEEIEADNAAEAEVAAETAVAADKV